MHKPLLALLLLLSAAAAASPVDEVQGPVSFSDLTGVMVLDNLYIAGQPSPEALAAAKAQGIEMVINLRTSGEMGYDEQAAAENMGLDYHQVPIAGPNGFTDQNLALLNSLAAASGAKNILVHCASGNRAGGWLAHYLADQKGVEVDEAFAAGRAAGLRSEQIETSLRQHLNPQP